MRSCCWLVMLAACVDSGAVQCSDGRTCPPSDACDTVHHTCVRPDQLTSCLDKDAGAACDIAASGDGICDERVCVVARCGDGYQRGDEACDGMDIPATVTCQSRGFYDAGTVTCNAACGIDDSACTGFCGDGVVTDGEEVCEPTVEPVLSCVDFGYGAGVLGCNMCAPGLEDCRRFGWETTAMPFVTVDVHGTSDDNVFVLGDGAVTHFDGNAWAPVDLSGCFGSAAASGLRRVWSIGDREAFVVGAAGTVLHLTSAGCTKLPAPTAADLYLLWASSASDLYVIENGGLWHFDGTAWTFPLAADLYSGVWGSSATDVYVVDAGNSVLHFDGTWSAPQAIPGMGSNGMVWGSSATDVYVSGRDASFKAYVAHFDGVSWQPSFDQAALIGGSASMVVDGASGGGTTIGTGFVITADVVPILMTSDGTGWTNLGSPTTRIARVWVSPTGSAYVVAPESAYVSVLSQIRFDAVVGNDGKGRYLAVRSANEVFAGSPPQGNTYRWNGFSWIVDYTAAALSVAVGPNGETYGISTAGGQGMFVYTPGASPAWALAKAGPSGTALSVVGTNDVWFVGGGVVAHWLGTFSTPSYPFAVPMSDVWVAGASDVFAVGGSGTIQHWNGTAFSAQTAPTTVDLTGVWGRSGNEVYAWGAETLLRYDGTSWTAMPLPPMTTPVGVWAGSPTDVFIITKAKGMLRFNGSRWAPVNIGTSLPLFDITGRGESIFVSDAVGGVHQLLRTATW